MIDVIIVEDNGIKLAKVCEYIDELIENARIEKCVDIISAKKAVTEKKFDLMILDLSIPNRCGSAPLNEGGLIFIRELKNRESYKKPTFIVGLTSYHELKDSYNEDFNNESYILIQYSNQDMAWKQPLENFIRRAANSRKRNEILNESKFNYDLGIITALRDPELNEVLRLTDTWEPIRLPNDPTTYYTGYFDRASGEKMRVVTASTPQMGLTATSQLSTKLIYNFRPQYMAMCGISAGFESKSNIGDVLISEYCWEYNMGKLIANEAEPEFLPDPKPLNLDASLRDKFTNLNTGYLDNIYRSWPADKPDNIPNIIVGPTCSGSFVLANKQILDMIQSHHRKVIGVDMETYGVFYSSVNSSEPTPKIFSAKTVCDFGTMQKDDRWQKYAAYISAQFVHRFVCEHL